MIKKLVLLMPVMIVLIGMLDVGFPIEAIEADGTIYIKADGSVDPPTVPIQRDGDLYTLTDNIYDSIVVERDNIVIDGAGYTIQGVGDEDFIESKGKIQTSLSPELELEPEPETVPGIDLSRRSNVTIKDINIKGFDDGVYLHRSSNNIISGNNITNNDNGVMLEGSSDDNRINGNNLTDNGDGIKLWGSCKYDIISGNNVTNGGGGIVFFGSCNLNSVSGNHIANNNFTGLDLYASSNNVISGNNITANDGEGIRLDSSYNNGIFENYIVNNKYTGLILDSFSVNNSISGNHVIADNGDGIVFSYSSNNSVSWNDVSANNDTGIELYDSSDNSVFENEIRANNNYGIVLDSSSNNSIYGNHVTGNAWGTVFRASSNNSIYHNNFMNNTVRVYDYSWDDPEVESSVNTWDDGYPSGGNYWDDYTGVDGDGDGIGDIAYVIDSNNRDRYPLMEMIPEDTISPDIAVLSPENKTYAVNDVALIFTVDEATVWIGYSLDGQGNVTIAGNTTLSNLSSGVHSLMIYAKDVAGNTGASEILYFSIETPAPFPTWIVAAIVTTVVFVASLLVYLTKFKKAI